MPSITVFTGKEGALRNIGGRIQWVLTGLIGPGGFCSMIWAASLVPGWTRSARARARQVQSYTTLEDLVMIPALIRQSRHFLAVETVRRQGMPVLPSRVRTDTYTTTPESSYGRRDAPWRQRPNGASCHWAK